MKPEETAKERGYGETRTRGVHLSVLVIMTLFLTGIISTALSLEWEGWVLPICIIGTVLSWILHITKRFSERVRLTFYMCVLWLLLVYHGVHETSFYDLVGLAAIEFALLALTEEKRLLHTGFVLFWFCYLWSGYRVFSAVQFQFTPLDISRIIGNLGVVITTYVVALHIIRKREREREEDNRMILSLQEARRHTEAFLVNVSQAFRTPVNIVIGASSAMTRTLESEASKKDAQRILNAGEYLSGQLNDLLDYTELSTGRFQLHNEPYMITSLVNDVLNAMSFRNTENRLELVIDVDPALPSLIRGDGRRLKRVMQHLIDNALRYTAGGGVYVRVYRMEEPYGMNLCIEVQDTGEGIRAEALDRIREGIYLREEEYMHVSEGFGLGLPIVYGMVHAMEGFVRIESEEGRGTTVHVSVPQQIADEASCMTIENQEEMKVAFYQQSGKFDVPVVRDYYAWLIMHVIRAFDLKLDRVSSLPDLKELMRETEYTHLFLADEEYDEDPDYFDRLSEMVHVIVVARGNFAVSDRSFVTVLKKPLCTIPLIEVLSAETERDAKDALLRGKREDFEGVRALVVDDEDMNLFVAADMFASYGMSVDTAKSGSVAILKTRKQDYDLIFMDHMMPGMDGIECAHRIRSILQSENRQTRIIALTANAASGAREMFAKEGFDAFLAKPVEQKELLRVLNTLLGETQ